MCEIRVSYKSNSAECQVSFSPYFSRPECIAARKPLRRSETLASIRKTFLSWFYCHTTFTTDPSTCKRAKQVQVSFLYSLWFKDVPEIEGHLGKCGRTDTDSEELRAD